MIVDLYDYKRAYKSYHVYLKYYKDLRYIGSFTDRYDAVLWCNAKTMDVKDVNGVIDYYITGKKFSIEGFKEHYSNICDD